MSTDQVNRTTRPDTGRAPTPASGGRKTSSDGLSGWAKTCAIYANLNLIPCADPDHYNRVQVTQAHIDQHLCVPGARLRDRRPVRKPNAEIIGLMVPYKRARCECERSACKDAWGSNKPGVFQSEYVQRPNLFKGVGKLDPEQQPRRVMPLGFRLAKREFDILHERFGNWFFVSEGSGGHDHPISHATTQVVAWELVNSLKPGKSYLDLHGNPTSNEWLRPSGVTLDTYVSLASAKDYLRKNTKWGPELDGQRRRYTIGPIISNRWHQTADSSIAENRDGFLSVHTGYYYQPAEVLSVLKKSPNATMTMVMHRFVGRDGSFNNDELKWVKETVGDREQVTQTNVATGERYVHPDNAFWFNRTSWTDVSMLDAHDRTGPDYEAPRALTWTLGQCCEGVYKVTVTSMPAYAAYLDEVTTDAPAPDDTILHWGGCDIEVGESTYFIPLPSKSKDLFDELRKKMNHQQRTEKKFAAHNQTCQQKAQLYDQKHGLKLTAKELSKLTVASFWVDFAHDLHNNTKLVVDADWAAASYSAVVTGATLKKTSNKVDAVLGLMSGIMKAGDTKSMATVLIDSLRSARTNL